jgi:anti-anti-sigma factor
MMNEDMNLCKNDNILVSKRGSQITLSISGNFDSSTTPVIHECCKKIEKKIGIKKIVLDFKQAKRVDTTAFACIIGFIKEHIGSDAEICVSNLRDPDKDLINILKIEKMIKVV